MQPIMNDETIFDQNMVTEEKQGNETLNNDVLVDNGDISDEGLSPEART